MKQNKTRRRNKSWRHYVLHLLRVTLFVTVILLIHWQSHKLTAVRSQSSLPIAKLTQWFPVAAELDVDHEQGNVYVVDDQDERLGYVIETSPVSDHIIGFSGPTNVVIAFDLADRVLGFDVVNSGDTRDHLRQVVEDETFMSSLNGLQKSDIISAQPVDAVSGATLTSLAIRESIAFRMSGGDSNNKWAKSLRFPDTVESTDVQSLFPNAATIADEPNKSGLLSVFDKTGIEIGRVLRTSPAADNVVGYQGPTESFVGLGGSGKVLGIELGKSYDNEPYVSYVREDKRFKSKFNGNSIDQLAQLDLDESGIEGVSGATMTSLAMAEGVIDAAEASRMSRAATAVSRTRPWTIGWHDIGTLLVILAAMAIGMTSLRGNRSLRVAFQVLLIVYLGLIAGNLVSQAMLVGWARHSIPWRSAPGLVLLTIAALAIPLTSRRNLFCTHLCPHGAAQQLLMNRGQRKWKIPHRLRLVLTLIPGLLLGWCLIVAMTSLGFSLVDIEPFDAYVFRIAGWATISIAIIGLVASLFVPMAYCHYGCPTGALLEFLRFNARSDRWSMRDLVAVGYLALALVLWVR